MSRYRAATGSEAEYEPGSRHRVLRNKLAIRMKTEIDRAEYDALVAVQKHYYVSRFEQDTVVTAALIRDMHRDWLGGIYDWAGQYRTVDMEKAGFRWPPAYLVSANMARYERDVLRIHTPCIPSLLHQVCRSIATVHADFLLIHPFREGNGRLARWIADIMAAQAGYPLPLYRFDGRGSTRMRGLYLEAVTSGYGENYEPLAAFFEEAIRARLDE